MDCHSLCLGLSSLGGMIMRHQTNQQGIDELRNSLKEMVQSATNDVLKDVRNLLEGKTR